MKIEDDQFDIQQSDFILVYKVPFKDTSEEFIKHLEQDMMNILKTGLFMKPFEISTLELGVGVFCPENVLIREMKRHR